MEMKCGGMGHPFDRCRVATDWFPQELQCLIVGENPGSPGKPYCYDPIQEYMRDLVEVRRRLLPALVQHKLMSSATREAFRDAGFLFDHAIRCQMDQDLIRLESKLAKQHRSKLVSQSTHLAPLIAKVPKVWIMGYLALAAVTKICWKEIVYNYGIHPNGRVVNDKFLLSPYFNRFSKESDIMAIRSNFKQFIFQ